MTKKPDGITLRCIRCKAKRTISFEEAKASGVPMCDECFMPMIIVEAKVTVR